jgi:hypothetical protein
MIAWFLLIVLIFLFLSASRHSIRISTKFGSAIRYEVAVCILTGELVWTNGPYEPGIWNGVAIFRNTLLSMLDEGERAETDDGYQAEAPRYIKCPASIGNHETVEKQASVVRRRHETINWRFKQWAILKQVDDLLNVENVLYEGLQL